MQLEHKFKVNIGDWSEDGHNQWKAYTVCSSVPLGYVQAAFKSAAERIGFLTYSHNDHPEFKLCKEYQEDYIIPEDVKTLEEAGVKIDDLLEVDFGDGNYYFIGDSRGMAHLLMRIAQIDLDFHYLIDDQGLPNFNGFWSQTLNMQAGYGLLDTPY